jgi:DNA-directed RNA polymerase subunit RPC12/RpoP
MTNPTDFQENDANQEITLRCSKCGKPITPAEAVLTPTGYRCRECVRHQQKIFDTNQPLDYVWGFLIALFLSLVGSFLTSFIGFYTVLLAPAAGVGIAEVVRAVIKKRRSTRLFRMVSIGVIIGGIPYILIRLFSIYAGFISSSFNLMGLLPLGYQILYLVLAVPSAYYRLSGSRRR